MSFRPTNGSGGTRSCFFYRTGRVADAPSLDLETWESTMIIYLAVDRCSRCAWCICFPMIRRRRCCGPDRTGSQHDCSRTRPSAPRGRSQSQRGARSSLPPALPQLRHDATGLFQRALRSILIRPPQPRTEQLVAGVDVQPQIAVAVVVAILVPLPLITVQLVVCLIQI